MPLLPTARSCLCSCLIAVAFLAASSASEAQGDTPDSGTPDAAATGALSVRLVELRNNNGQIGCGLWSSERGFPKDRSVALQTKWCACVNAPRVRPDDSLPPGAVSVASLAADRVSAPLWTLVAVVVCMLW